MILIDRSDAERLLMGVRYLSPLFPKHMSEQLALFEEQMTRGNCDESLLLQINVFISKYILKKSTDLSKEMFFEEKRDKSDHSIFVAREMCDIINWLLLDQTEKQNRNYRGIRR